MIDLVQWRCAVGAWSARITRHSQPSSIKWRNNDGPHCLQEYSRDLLLLVYSVVVGGICGVHQLLSVALVATLLLLLCGDVERNPGPSDDPLEVFKKHLSALISTIRDPIKLANDMFSLHHLIPEDTKVAVLTINSDSCYSKSSILLNTFRRLKLQMAPDATRAKDNLVTLCKVLGDLPVTREILKDIGINEDVFFEDLIAENDFIQIMKTKARSEVISQPPEWMPRGVSVDKKYYGRLMLLNMKKDFSDEQTAAWYHTRGKLDRVPIAKPSSEPININSILVDCDKNRSANKSSGGVILIDGPPGIGKTTLCRKISQMWATGELRVKFTLALTLSLRQTEVVNAKNIEELMQTAYTKYGDAIPSLCKLFNENDGKGLLLIFDGWDEFPEESIRSSFVSKLITKKILYCCTVIVTSRSYASESLLHICRRHYEPIKKHVQILGFSYYEVHGFIKAAFKENHDKAKSLISELDLRSDISSICCIPIVCFMLIFVYGKMQRLPHTMTELYTNFILQTIKTEVSKQNVLFSVKRIEDIDNLPNPINNCLDQLCLFSYNMLIKEPNPTLMFDSRFDSQLKLAKDNTFLGLMTTFQSCHGDDCYQFIHLTIQEYLAALWMSKQPNCHKLFKNHFNSPHFHMTLRFVAGLTKLHHSSYETFFSVPINLKCRTKAIPMFAQQTWLEMKTNCLIPHQKGRGWHVWESAHSVHQHIHAPEDPFTHLHNTLKVRLLHFLHESQNCHLFKTFASSIFDFTICTFPYTMLPSTFDWYCLIYLLTRSSVKWNHIHLTLPPYDRSMPAKIHAYIDKENKCTCDRLIVDNNSWMGMEANMTLLQLFECKSVFYVINNRNDLDDFINKMQIVVHMPEIKEIHIAYNMSCKFNRYSSPADDKNIKSVCHEISEIIAESQTLNSIEIRVQYYGHIDADHESGSLMRSVLKIFLLMFRKVKYSKHLKVLSVIVSEQGRSSRMSLDDRLLYAAYCDFIEELIHYNTTLETIQFILPMLISSDLDGGSSSIPRGINIRYDNSNLSTVNVHRFANPLQQYGDYFQQMTTFTNILELKRCLNLHYICFMHSGKEEIIDFLSQIPIAFRNLQILELHIQDPLNDTKWRQDDVVKKLCQVMEHNHSVQALKVSTPFRTQCTHECAVALKQLLLTNQTLECLELRFFIPADCLHYIQSGLQYNTTLKELAMEVHFSIGEDLIQHYSDEAARFFFKTNLKSMVVYLDEGFEYSDDHDKIFSKFYFTIIPSISLLLHQNKQLELLTMRFIDYNTQYHYIPSRKAFKPGPDWIELARSYIQQLLKVLQDHPSLKYIEICCYKDLLMNEIKQQIAAQKYPELMKRKIILTRIRYE